MGQASGSARSRPRSSRLPPGTAPKPTTRIISGNIPAATAVIICAISALVSGNQSGESKWVAGILRLPVRPGLLEQERYAGAQRVECNPTLSREVELLQLSVEILPHPLSHCAI